ncbi:SDR family NAD(P)-dependent oxidoreductase [Diaminobutyricibacter sp. McL0618]|uniref:SDR family NAD(P)-dependent oxidoreductase n=1 Tax=Leifsonia sp. McL0618 TaxID=3415677 RepID=UPI003CEE305C
MLPNLLDLSDHVVLINGGCGELGAAITDKLVDAGASVLVNDILPESEAQSRFRGRDRVEYFRSSGSTPEAAKELVQQCADRFGSLPDTVLCHVGLVESHEIDRFPIQRFDDIMNTNVRTNFLLGQAAADAWKGSERSGHLIFTSSWVAETPWPGIAPYGASKAAINSLTRSFARELAADGIRANAISPGIVGAGMAKRQWDTEPDYQRRASKAIPLGELQSVDSVANAFLFLCSNMASYMTGSVLVVDGGCGLYPMD